MRCDQLEACELAHFAASGCLFAFIVDCSVLRSVNATPTFAIVHELTLSLSKKGLLIDLAAEIFANRACVTDRKTALNNFSKLIECH